MGIMKIIGCFEGSKLMSSFREPSSLKILLTEWWSKLSRALHLVLFTCVVSQWKQTDQRIDCLAQCCLLTIGHPPDPSVDGSRALSWWAISNSHFRLGPTRTPLTVLSNILAPVRTHTLDFFWLCSSRLSSSQYLICFYRIRSGNSGTSPCSKRCSRKKTTWLTCFPPLRTSVSWRCHGLCWRLREKTEAASISEQRSTSASQLSFGSY